MEEEEESRIPSTSMTVEMRTQQRIQNLSLAADGEASYVCEFCGNVISLARRTAHEQSWCPAIHKQ